MNRLIGIINSMNYRELKEIQKDLAEGNIGKLIKARIDSIEKTLGYNEKVCATCGNSLTEENIRYSLVFGPSDFRKRASFCGNDCLSFFMEKLKQQERDKVIGSE
jgi:hypothetical protein